jgi:hypothetical protein
VQEHRPNFLYLAGFLLVVFSLYLVFAWSMFSGTWFGASSKGGEISDDGTFRLSEKVLSPISKHIKQDRTPRIRPTTKDLNRSNKFFGDVAYPEFLLDMEEKDLQYFYCDQRAGKLVKHPKKPSDLEEQTKTGIAYADVYDILEPYIEDGEDYSYHILEICEGENGAIFGELFIDDLDIDMPKSFFYRLKGRQGVLIPSLTDATEETCATPTMITKKDVVYMACFSNGGAARSLYELDFNTGTMKENLSCIRLTLEGASGYSKEFEYSCK